MAALLNDALENIYNCRTIPEHFHNYYNDYNDDDGCLLGSLVSDAVEREREK